MGLNKNNNKDHTNQQPIQKPNENIAELKGLYQGLKGNYNSLSSRYNNISKRLDNINQKLDGFQQQELNTSPTDVNIPNDLNNANNHIDSAFNNMGNNAAKSEPNLNKPDLEIPSTNINNNASPSSNRQNNENKAEEVTNQIINGAVNNGNNNKRKRNSNNSLPDVSYEEYPPRTKTASAYHQMGGKLKNKSKRIQKAGSLIANHKNIAARKNNSSKNINANNKNTSNRSRNNNNNNSSRSRNANNNNSELSENSSISVSNNNNSELSENSSISMNDNNLHTYVNNNKNRHNARKYIKHRETYGEVDSKIEAFKYFVENYYSNPHLSAQVFDILNKIPMDYSTKTDLCYEQKNGEVVPRKINIDSKYFAQFKRNYENLQNHYITYSNKLSQILEQMMYVDPQDETKKHLKLLTSADLLMLEENTRKLLKNYYSGCQDMYTIAIKELEKAVTDLAFLERQKEL
jgi:hypothetical protein